MLESLHPLYLNAFEDLTFDNLKSKFELRGDAVTFEEANYLEPLIVVSEQLTLKDYVEVTGECVLTVGDIVVKLRVSDIKLVYPESRSYNFVNADKRNYYLILKSKFYMSKIGLLLMTDKGESQGKVMRLKDLYLEGQSMLANKIDPNTGGPGLNTETTESYIRESLGDNEFAILVENSIGNEFHRKFRLGSDVYSAARWVVQSSDALVLVPHPTKISVINK